MKRLSPRMNGCSSELERGLNWECLESRRVLAVGISFDPTGGVITVTGDGAADTVLVANSSGGMIQVQGTGTATQYFNSAFVNRVDFFGNSGNDLLENQTVVATRAYGNAGNDELIGGSGNDLLNGGAGNDQLSGNDGNDTLLGGEADDDLFGGAGSDQLLGYLGNDWLDGGDGNDGLYGQAGNDQVYGHAGNDNVRGNMGFDQLFGGDGNDYMMGDTEDDEMIGDAGDDTLFGWSGQDLLRGGSGNDSLYGQDDVDDLGGDDGDDLLRGGLHDDVLRGGNADDRLYGEAGDDLLRGDAGVDLLRGGDGMDSLIGGGLVGIDTLYGDAEADRFLTQDADLVVDSASDDATLRFVDETSSWTDREIEVLDGGFARLCAETGNIRLLIDSLDTRDLGFYKYADLGGAAGINALWTSGSYELNSQGQWEWVYTYEREIRILDWDENSSWYNDAFQQVAIHEIGHNWDSALELGTISSQVGQLWDTFLNASGWVDTNPNDPANYDQSQDGEWWYLESAAFADDYGQTNPNEDMATMWEYFFNPAADPSQAAALHSKLNVLESFFQAMQS